MDHLQEKIQALLDSFVEKGTECGCQAALYINGELAVNAYAGWTDWTKTRKIDADTVFPIYSTGKAIASTVIHRLVEKGILDYDMYVGDVWPEYACKGKEKTKLWHMLAYRMGMMQEPEYRTGEERADWNLMCSRLAAMEPAYPPGTKQQYHPSTYGWLIGEVACRATGKDFATLCREEVCRPAGMDRFFYGIAEDEENTATLVKALDGRCYSEEVIERMNKPVFRRCCNPSTCTMSNALSIARHYAALDTCTLLTRETIDNATILRRAEDDMIPIEPGRWELFGLGYVLSGPKDDLGRIFGHGGVGGTSRPETALCDRLHAQSVCRSERPERVSEAHRPEKPRLVRKVRRHCRTKKSIRASISRKIGALRIRLSTRSITPPIPGISFPESLTPQIRFSDDSARSPAAPNRKRSTPGISASSHEYPVTRGNSATENAIVSSSPPKNPSHDFPGLIDGMSL